MSPSFAEIQKMKRSELPQKDMKERYKLPCLRKDGDPRVNIRGILPLISGPELKIAEKGGHSWRREGVARMALNNLVQAQHPNELIIYGGSGRVACTHKDLMMIIASLAKMEDKQTLVIQSGKPVAILPTHDSAPTVAIVNSVLVPHWATQLMHDQYYALGLTMYGQMTAGSFSYVGTQGIAGGTYLSFFEAGRQKLGLDSLKGKLILTSGCGAMGGAQPLAGKMNDAVIIVVDVKESAIQRKVDEKWCDRMTHSLDEALQWAVEAKRKGESLSIGLVGNAADIYPKIAQMASTNREYLPDIVTSQTPAHSTLDYVPYIEGLSLERTLAMKEEPEKYIEAALNSMCAECKAMVSFKELGAYVFDYGNNLRGQVATTNPDIIVDDKGKFKYAGFVVDLIRPQFCEGRGPFRWVAFSGDPKDIETVDNMLKQTYASNEGLVRWLTLAGKYITHQGLPSRVCWFGMGERDEVGVAMNNLVAQGKVSAPLWITRDHLDTGSVASPNRETEGMLDGSDAIGDWPVINALLNAINGATLVAFHQGGGVGIPYSLHAGMGLLVDGTKEQGDIIRRVLYADPASGVVRHADAGYKAALEIAMRYELTPDAIRVLDNNKAVDTLWGVT
jgi:urocanate hydratase